MWPYEIFKKQLRRCSCFSWCCGFEWLREPVRGLGIWVCRWLQCGIRAELKWLRAALTGVEMVVGSARWFLDGCSH